MIVPPGNAGDTRLSVPFPARAAAAPASYRSNLNPLPPAARKPPSRAIIALCNKDRDAGSKGCCLILLLIHLLPRRSASLTPAFLSSPVVVLYHRGYIVLYYQHFSPLPNSFFLFSSTIAGFLGFPNFLNFPRLPCCFSLKRR